MKKVYPYILFVLSICLLIGCNNTNNIIELNNNLAAEIEMDITGASAVCTVNFMTSGRRSSVGGKAVIFSENDIVTKVQVVELAESNDVQSLQNMQVAMLERHELIKEYGGHEQETSIANRRLTVRGTVNHNQVEWERMVYDDPTLSEFLNDDFRFTLDSMIRFLELHNNYRCEIQ